MPSTDMQPQQKSDTVVAEPVLTEWQALRQAGWVQPIDFMVLFLVFMVILTMIFWSIFGEPTGIQLMSCAIVGFIITQLWSILLVFRCMHFVLKTQAYMNMLPYEAARIAISQITGRAPEQPNK